MSDAPAAPAADGAAADRVALDASWKARVGHRFEREDMRALADFLRREKRAGKTIYPPGPRLFAALDTTPFDAVKVVILGQDPYHGPDQAHGLCFSVLPGVPVPPSLDNIFKEIERDLGACRTYGIESENVPARGQMFDDSPADSGSIGQEAADVWTAQADLQPVLHKSGRLPGIARPDHGCLLPWARQGVLLLNAVLTVERGRAGSHQGKGWEGFTDACVEALNREREDLVFLLWGSYAQAKGKLIDPRRHRVLKAAHPSPLSAHRGFLGCAHFSRTNEYLVQRGFAPINWRLPPRAGLVVD